MQEGKKASQNIVNINTPTGVHQLTMPATYRQVLASPQRDAWHAANLVAYNTLLAWSGNRLVSVDVSRQLVLPISKRW